MLSKLVVMLPLAAYALASNLAVAARNSDLTPSLALRADAPLCPDSDNQTYIDPDGFNYTIRCSADGAPPNMAFLNIFDLPTCIKACSDFNLGGPLQNCTAVVVSTYGCYFKSSSVLYYNTAADLVGAASLNSFPETYPAPPVSFNASCPGDEYSHYLGPAGFTYSIVCTLDANIGQDLTNSVQMSLPDCLLTCSQYNIANPPPSTQCSGAVWLPPSEPSIDVLRCYLKSGVPIYTEKPNRETGFVVAQPATCELSNPYDTPEGDDYNVDAIAASNTTSILASSNQYTPCGCAESCSRYNLYYNATLCKGCEFDPNGADKPMGATCLIKSS